MFISKSTILVSKSFLHTYQGRLVTCFKTPFKRGCWYLVEGDYTNLPFPISKVTVCYYSTSLIYNPYYFIGFPEFHHRLNVPVNPFRIGVVSSYES